MRALLVILALATGCFNPNYHNPTCSPPNNECPKGMTCISGVCEYPAPNDANGDPNCVMDPHTHEEIINACTSDESVDKMSHPPLILSDGGLPEPPPGIDAPSIDAPPADAATD